MRYARAISAHSVAERAFFSDNLRRHGAGAEDWLFPNLVPDVKRGPPLRLRHRR
jgi:hypothetical protein